MNSIYSELFPAANSNLFPMAAWTPHISLPLAKPLLASEGPLAPVSAPELVSRLLPCGHGSSDLAPALLPCRDLASVMTIVLLGHHVSQHGHRYQ